MLKIGGHVGYRILTWIAPGWKRGSAPTSSAYAGRNKLTRLLGEDILAQLVGKDVLDFGCGEGSESVALAEAGARRVIGLDMRETVLHKARACAEARNMGDRCRFVSSFDEQVDAVISLDAFEHFADPTQVLATMHAQLRGGGRAYISFGPTWFHPLGGHLFSVFPWSHLIFSESALIRWRTDFKTDGATQFSEVEGGLNQMTIRRFEELITASKFELEMLRLIPIRRFRYVHCRQTREATTSVVQAVLKKRL